MKLSHTPITIAEANEIVRAHHRHNKPVTGGRFAIAAKAGGKVVGVCIVGRTTARLLHGDDVGEVTRLCATPDAPKNTCSYLYGVARRVWQAMGGSRLITYTLASEPGSSLAAAGWARTATTKASQNWHRSRPGRARQAVASEDKVRWEAKLHQARKEGAS